MKLCSQEAISRGNFPADVDQQTHSHISNIVGEKISDTSDVDLPTATFGEIYVISSSARGADETEGGEKLEEVGSDGGDMATDNCNYGGGMVGIGGNELVERGKAVGVYDMEVVRRFGLENEGEFGWNVKEYFWEVLVVFRFFMDAIAIVFICH